MGTFVLIVVTIVGLVIYLAVRHASKKEAARQAYMKSLAELKASPTNADLRQQTLASGRVYADFTRNNKGITVFDEVALMNDINAACAAAVVHETETPVPAVSATAEDRLRILTDLKTKGLIAEGEFAERRGEILSSI